MSRSSAAALGMALLFVGCGKSNPVTPPSTTLVEWDASKATRQDFAKATIGKREAKDFTVTVAHKDAPSFKLAVHVEMADVDYTEGGKPIHQHAPVAIKVAIRENTGWDLSGKCSDGPNYKMPGTGPDGALVTPMGMSQECPIKENRESGVIFNSSWQIGFSIIAEGDGTLKAFPDTDVKIE